MKPASVYWGAFDKWVGYAEDWSMAALLAAASCLGLFQIVMRYGFSMGYDWVEAYLIMFVVYAALIGASVAVRRKVHVQLDVLVNKFPDRARWGIHLLTHLLCLFYTCALWLFGLKFVMQTIQFDNMNILSDLPEWVHYTAVPIGLGLMSIRYIQEIVTLLVAAPAHFKRGDA
jgi:C4-dicarboxylate transporter, DctQ subunit